MLFKRAGGQGGEDGEGRDDANANVDGVDELKEAVGDKTWNGEFLREIRNFVKFTHLFVLNLNVNKNFARLSFKFYSVSILL